MHHMIMRFDDGMTIERTFQTREMIGRLILQMQATTECGFTTKVKDEQRN